MLLSILLLLLLVMLLRDARLRVCPWPGLLLLLLLLEDMRVGRSGKDVILTKNDSNHHHTDL